MASELISSESKIGNEELAGRARRHGKSSVERYSLSKVQHGGQKIFTSRRKPFPKNFVSLGYSRKCISGNYRLDLKHMRSIYGLQQACRIVSARIQAIMLTASRCTKSNAVETLVVER